MVNQPLHRVRGVKVLKAVSSPFRLQILNLLFDKNALSYTELMNQLKMNPSRDAGRFAYHLKFMLKADLVEADVEAKKYFLTDLGKMVLDVADRVEKKAIKPRGMMVRTSHLTLEEFDSNKIANSLIKEAKVPAELAQKAAKEAEKRLVKSKTKYLTASLIREVVNAILVEKGYEEYRHKLTRVGMPIHEVTALIEAKDSTQTYENALSKAGKTVLSEYTLLNIFPRDIADAHLSGAINMDELGTWLLKPTEIIHDLRYFFQHGIGLLDPKIISIAPPSNLESALSVTFNVLLHSNKEVNNSQTFSYFDVFLAPFVRGNDVTNLKEKLRLFILNLNQHVNVTLALDPSISKQTAEKTAIGPLGKSCGTYRDYIQEIQLIDNLVIDILLEESPTKPLNNPKIIVKVNNSAIADEASREILLRAHQLAAQSGTPYFANTTKRENMAFSSSGVKLSADLTGDWETDTLRTGCLGWVSINLPRITMECEKDKSKFLDIAKERFELAARALAIKNNALKQFGKNSLPFLLQKANGDTYFRLENCSRIVNLTGFKEAVESFTQKSIDDPESRKFGEEIITNLLAFKQKVGRKYGKRLYPVILSDPDASERFAQIDIERYGIAKVRFTGSRDKPYYSTVSRIPIKSTKQLSFNAKDLETMQITKGLVAGGSLEIFELEMEEYQPEALVELTKQLAENGNIEFLTYNRIVSYCDNCHRNWRGKFYKCPSCGSMSTLTTFDRFIST